MISWWYAAAAVLTHCLAAEGSFKQDVFAIGAFLDPAPTLVNYQQMREANFSVLLSTYVTNASTMALQAELCALTGLRCILSGPATQFPHQSPSGKVHPDTTCKGRVDPTALYTGPHSDAVWGYYLWDEPYENSTSQPRLDMYEWLHGLQVQIHAGQPDSLVFINGGDGASELAFDEAYAEAVQPDVYSFDFYPSFGGMINGVVVHDTRGQQLRLLEAARLTAQKFGLPLWNWFAVAGSLGVPYGTATAACMNNPTPDCLFVDITAAQFAWQAWTSLAFGSRGLWLYFYQQPAERQHCRPFIMWPGVLAQDGTRSHHYADAAALNAKIMALGPTLMQLKSTGTTMIDLNDPGSKAGCPGRGLNCTEWPTLGTIAEAGCPIRNVTGGSFVLGCFEHETDPATTAVLVMNYEVLYNLFATTEFDAPAGATVREVCQTSGRQVPVIDDAPGSPGLQLLLRPGAGRLFLVGPPPPAVVAH